MRRFLECFKPSHSALEHHRVVRENFALLAWRVQSKGLRHAAIAFNYRRHVAAYPFGQIHLAVLPSKIDKLSSGSEWLHEIKHDGFRGHVETWSPRVLSILRIIVGLLFLEHGTSKYLSLPVSPSTGVAPISLSGINGMIELVGGVLIVLGLFTRPVAFILAGDMAVAYFI
jgi:DoxX